MAQVQVDIVSQAVKCQLITEQQVAVCRAKLGEDPAGDALLNSLLGAELLTRWQVKQLAAGKTGGFFVSHYKLLAPLGAGGMGQVFRAADTNVARRQVAVKILPRQAATPAAVSRFRREGAAALVLQHDHVVRCFELGQHGETPFLVMEIVEGATLKEYIAKNGKLTVEETARIGYEISLALAHAAEHGIVHRDIKPANILLTRDNHVKLADLGLAKFFGPQGDAAQSLATRTGMLMGTLDYLSPEQAEDAKRADVRSDIYSLGCTLYHCLTGGAPFSGGTEVQTIMAHRDRPPPSITGKNPEVENLFADLIERQMLAKRPEDRFQTPELVAAALEPWLGKSSRAFNVLDLLEAAVQQDASAGAPVAARPATQQGWETYQEYERQGAIAAPTVRPTGLQGQVQRVGRAIGLSSLRDTAIAGVAVAAVALALIGIWRWNHADQDLADAAAAPDLSVASDGSETGAPINAPAQPLPKRELKPVQWSVLDPQEFTSQGGATFKKFDDRSLLVSGVNPAKDIYTVVAQTDLPHITGLRLEVLTDDSLTRRGPGRSKNGNIALTGLSVAVAPRENRNAAQAVGVVDCMASYSQATQQIRSVIDLRYGSGWGIDAGNDGFNIDRFAVFEFDRDASIPAGATLIVTLKQESGWEQHTLGRFRLSVTSSESPVRNSGGTITPQEANKDVFRLADLLYLQQVQEYRRDCAAVIARVDESNCAVNVANDLGWAAALGPGDTPEFPVALRLMEAAVAKAPSNVALLNTYSGVLCRAERFADAIRYAKLSIEKQPPPQDPRLPGLPPGTAYDWLILAIANHHLGNVGEARQWFDHAAQHIDWSTQSGRAPASDRIPYPVGRDLLYLRRLAERELGIPATALDSAVIVGDWKFAHRYNGTHVNNGDNPGLHQQPGNFRDDSGGGTRVTAAYEGVQPPCYAVYSLPGDRRAGLDGRGLDMGAGKGAVHYWNSPPALRPMDDFSFWMRVQPQKTVAAGKQILASRPDCWTLQITPRGRIHLLLATVQDKQANLFNAQGPDVSSKANEWVDVGFSFQGRADDGDAADDTVKIYVDGQLVGTFSVDAAFSDEFHLHLGMGNFGVFRCECLVDRVLCFRGVLDAAGFEQLTGTPSGEAVQTPPAASSSTAVEAPSPKTRALPDPGSLEAFRDKLGQVLYFEVTGSTTGDIWGTDIYTYDSPLAVAAVHAGALEADQKGIVKVAIVPGIVGYVGSERKGVSSGDWPAYSASYRVAKANTVPAQPEQLVANPFDLTPYRGQNGLKLIFELQARTSGTIYGTGAYTDDSDLRTAVVHAGLLADGERGAIVVTFLPGQDIYRGTARNGVTSQSFGKWSGSVRLAPFK